MLCEENLLPRFLCVEVSPLGVPAHDTKDGDDHGGVRVRFGPMFEKCF